MRPPLIRGGNARSRKPKRSCVPGFNEAAPDQGRKSNANHASPQETASFNEAAPHQGRKFCAGRQETKRKKSFNEAAPHQGRKWEREAKYSWTWEASMRPPLIRGGNRRAKMTAAHLLRWLQ